MLQQRLISGVLLGGGLVAGVFILPPVGVLAVLLLIGALALLEFYALLDAREIPHFKIVGLIGGLALIGGTWFSAYTTDGRFADFETVLLFGVTATIFVRQITHRKMERAWETMAGTLLGIIYVAFLFSFFVKLYTSWGDVEGRYLILYLVAVVKSTDIGAYFTGCSIGRNKLIPRISPGKTWEGVIGGVLFGVLVSYLFVRFMSERAGVLYISTMDSIVLGALLAITGVLGDLIESLLKRSVGVKDSSKMIAGMGGLLDVLDSLLFSVPVLYVYARFFMTP